MTATPPNWVEPPLEAYDDAPGVPAVRRVPDGPTLSSTVDLPSSLDAEREVLASVFASPSLAMAVVGEHGLTAADFFSPTHSVVFESLSRVSARRGSVDPVLVRQDLVDHGDWDRAGGAATLGALLERAGTTANLGHYCRVVADKARLRRWIETIRRSEAAALGDIDDVEAFITEREAELSAAGGSGRTAQLRPARDVCMDVLTTLEHTAEATGHVTGLATGWPDLDRLTQGLQGSDLIIVAARPSIGKTAFALNLADNAARILGKQVAVFSAEMPDSQLLLRALASVARIDLSRLRAATLDADDWARLTSAADLIAKSGLWIHDAHGVTPAAIRGACIRHAQRHGLDLVVVDYLQLLKAGVPARSREEEVAYISRSLKGLAKELNIPVVALAQLNRGPEGRQDKRPMLSDLRDSGQLEQDADLVIGLYRDEVYRSVDPDQRGRAEVLLLKHRNGPIGKVELKFWASHVRFDSLARSEYP
jgi:replicative DNA helicase